VSTVPGPDPPTLLTPGELRRRRRGRRRRTLLLTAVALLILVPLAAAGWLLVRDRDRLPERTTIGGVDVGGRTDVEARRLLERASARRAAEPIAVVHGADAFTVTGTDLGARPLVDEALEAADDAGPLERVLAHVGVGGRDVPLRFGLDRGLVAGFAEQLDASIARPPRDARVRITAAGLVTTEAVEGSAVNRGALNTRLRRLAPRVAVPMRPVAPTVATRAADRARRRAERLLSGPRVVSLGPARVTLRPSTLRRALRFEPRGPRLAVALDPGVLGARLRQTWGGLERGPVDARFVIEGDAVRLQPSVDGRQLDVEGIARSLLDEIDRPVHRTRLLVVHPALTTKEARALHIREQVSGFTTPYPCCAPRVQNIQRAAEILNGMLLLPGKTFSLNEALGRRTKARGFVEAPQIFDGRLEDAVGGGVSQVATTMYNAAFFAGLQLVAHSPHQFYISRYPMGREATVSWGGPELIFRNDWPAGILIGVTATDTSITVRFFSAKLKRRVETTTGEPYDPVQPVTRVVTNLEKPPGSREQVQDAGDPGFSVDYTRKVWSGDRVRRRERWTVHYIAQDAIVEVGPPRS
jgi:vancomycin resistance protein YoaR